MLELSFLNEKDKQKQQEKGETLVVQNGKKAWRRGRNDTPLCLMLGLPSKKRLF